MSEQGQAHFSELSYIPYWLGWKSGIDKIQNGQRLDLILVSQDRAVKRNNFSSELYDYQVAWKYCFMFFKRKEENKMKPV